MKLKKVVRQVGVLLIDKIANHLVIGEIMVFMRASAAQSQVLN